MSVFGNILGVRMNLLVGPDPVVGPAPLSALESLEEIEVKLADTKPSGIRMSFSVGRSGPLDFLETPLVADPRFDIGARVIVTMVFGVVPTPIFDGVISKRKLQPGSGIDEGRLTLYGEDLAGQLDKECKRQEHIGMDETAIALAIAGQYPQYGMVPLVIPPKVIDPPIAVDRTPVQTMTDLEYLRSMAQRHGYETYVMAGPTPGANILYWGPPITPELPQRTLSVNQGPSSDAFDIDIDNSVDELSKVTAAVLDRLTGKTIPIVAPLPTRPPLGLAPEAVRKGGQVRTKCLETSGLNAAQAQARAFGKVDADAAAPVRVTGSLNTIKYNAALLARRYVDLRGVGLSFDGTYKVAEVRHRITPGDYAQDFTLTRSEIGPKAPVVRTV
jgi:hypothetical protein